MKVLIDNGHGSDTLGKHSPDRTLYEWKWNRDIALRLEAALKAKGYSVERVVKEDNDVSRSERVRRVNAICAKEGGSSKCVLVEIHINAAGGDGQWHNATGWSGWVAPNASSKSKDFAQMLYAEAAKRGLQGNRCVPPQKYWVGNFTVIKNTACPAVLTENLFQDNQGEARYLMSEKGKQTIVDLHVAALEKYIEKYG